MVWDTPDLRGRVQQFQQRRLNLPWKPPQHANVESSRLAEALSNSAFSSHVDGVEIQEMVRSLQRSRGLPGVKIVWESGKKFSEEREVPRKLACAVLAPTKRMKMKEAIRVIRFAPSVFLF